MAAVVDNLVVIWNFKTGEELMTLDGGHGEENLIDNITISPDGKWLVSVVTTVLILWDA